MGSRELTQTGGDIQQCALPVRPAAGGGAGSESGVAGAVPGCA